MTRQNAHWQRTYSLHYPGCWARVIDGHLPVGTETALRVDKLDWAAEWHSVSDMHLSFCSLGCLAPPYGDTGAVTFTVTFSRHDDELTLDVLEGELPRFLRSRGYERLEGPVCQTTTKSTTVYSWPVFKPAA